MSCQTQYTIQHKHKHKYNTTQHNKHKTTTPTHSTQNKKHDNNNNTTQETVQMDRLECTISNTIHNTTQQTQQHQHKHNTNTTQKNNTTQHISDVQRIGICYIQQTQNKTTTHHNTTTHFRCTAHWNMQYPIPSLLILNSPERYHVLIYVLTPHIKPFTQCSYVNKIKTFLSHHTTQRHTTQHNTSQTPHHTHRTTPHCSISRCVP